MSPVKVTNLSAARAKGTPNTKIAAAMIASNT